MRPLVVAAAVAPALPVVGGLLQALQSSLGLPVPSFVRASSILFVTSYFVLTLALALTARGPRAPGWIPLAVLAALPLLLTLFPVRVPPAYSAVGFAAWAAVPVALALAALRWVGARGRRPHGASLAFLALLAAALVVQVANNPAFSRTGMRDALVYNLLGILVAALLLSALATLTGEARRDLRALGVALGAGGALLAAAAMATLLALGELRPIEGIVHAAFALHALGSGALHAGVGCVAVALLRGPRGAKAHDEAASMEPRALV